MKPAKSHVPGVGLDCRRSRHGPARDQIQIAGLSTVQPYATIVAEAFGENTDFPTPVVESGAARRAEEVPRGLGDNTIDIANASVPMVATVAGGSVACKAAGGPRSSRSGRTGYRCTASQR